jgi:hypothetical protein
MEAYETTGTESETHYAELLGVTLPEDDEGGEDGSNNAPPEEGAEDGADAGGDTEGGAEDGADTGGDTEGAEPEDDEKRRRNAQSAERRRQSEERQRARIQSEVERALAEERARTNAVIAGLGMLDADGGETIKSVDDLVKFNAARELARAGESLSNGELTPEAFNKLVEQTPAMRQASAIIAKAERAEAEARQAQANAEAERQIAEIGKYDPAIKNVGDLLKLDRADTLRGYVMDKGLTLVDAYRLTYADVIESRRASQAAAQASKLARSKQHLTRTETRGAAPPEIPEEERKYFRAIFPDASEDAISKMYARDIAKYGERGYI